MRKLPEAGRERRIARSKVAQRVIRPIARFMEVEASGGIVLLACVALAMAWANSPWSDSYFNLLNLPLGLSAGSASFRMPLQLWVNDLLMAVFFFVVGLEIKREVVVGEISSLRRAALPMTAAVGGMALPALLYLAINAGREGARGWGIPMATDIAFSLGVLALVGSRAPMALKVFLTALAIVDDLGAVLVIALAYTGGVSMAHVGMAAVVLLLLVAANAIGIRALLAYCSLGFVLWIILMGSGLHATIAGVLTALTVPLWTRIDVPTLAMRLRDVADAVEEPVEAGGHGDEDKRSRLEGLARDCEAAQVPLERLEHLLHPWVTYGIVPVFAFANAGIRLDGNLLADILHPVSLGIVCGLFLGKTLGILGSSWLAVRFGVAELPRKVSWRHLLGVGALGGIGFTMSLFVATLAFEDTHLLEIAKIGILTGSVVSGSVGLAVLWLQKARLKPQAAVAASLESP